MLFLFLCLKLRSNQDSNGEIEYYLPLFFIFLRLSLLSSKPIYHFSPITIQQPYSDLVIRKIGEARHTFGDSLQRAYSLPKFYYPNK
jgi:hypothetical protein